MLEYFRLLARYNTVANARVLQGGTVRVAIGLVLILAEAGSRWLVVTVTGRPWAEQAK